MVVNIIRKFRTKIFTSICKRTAKHWGSGLHINHWCKFNSRTVIGDNCHFNGMKIAGKGNVTIGDNFHSGGSILVITSNHNYDKGNAIPYDDTTIDGDIIIENNVWIGESVILLRGITIGEGAIIQAGSVVVSDIEACAIAGGHPAVVFKYRDKEHYYRLKKKANSCNIWIM